MAQGIRISFMILVLLGMAISTSYAHELILKPQEWHAYSPGQELPFSIVSSHTFMKSDELEVAETVAASYNGQSIPLSPNEAFKSFDGVVTLGDPGAALIHGHRQPQVWSRTTEGWKMGDATTLQNVVTTRKFEKFCKTLLPVGGKSDGWDKRTGDALEIVPINNPLELAPGDILEVQILHNGQPVSPEMVLATYDGFTDLPDSYAFFTEPYGSGNAKIQISAPGLWMVRTQYVEDVQGKNYEKHVMRAVMVFPVR